MYQLRVCERKTVTYYVSEDNCSKPINIHVLQKLVKISYWRYATSYNVQWTLFKTKNIYVLHRHFKKLVQYPKNQEKKDYNVVSPSLFFPNSFSLLFGVLGQRWGSQKGAIKEKSNFILTHQVHEIQTDILKAKGIKDTRKVNTWKNRQD